MNRPDSQHRYLERIAADLRRLHQPRELHDHQDCVGDPLIKREPLASHWSNWRTRNEEEDGK